MDLTAYMQINNIIIARVIGKKVAQRDDQAEKMLNQTTCKKQLAESFLTFFIIIILLLAISLKLKNNPGRFVYIQSEMTDVTIYTVCL